MIHTRAGQAGLLLIVLLVTSGIRPARAQEALSVDQSIAAAHAELRKHDYSEAGRILEDALKRFPSDTRLQVELGRVFVYRRQDDQAVELFRSVLKQQPSNRTAKLELARVLSYWKKYKDSDQLFRELLSSDPADEAAGIGLIRNLILQRKVEEARREVEEALSRHPNSLRLHEYRDTLDKRQPAGGATGEEAQPDRIFADGSYFSDTAGHRS